jgi:hypothetical protein
MSVSYKTLTTVAPLFLAEQERLAGIIADSTVEEIALLENVVAAQVSAGKEYFFKKIDGCPDCPIVDDPVLTTLVKAIRMTQENLRTIRRRVKTGF